MVDVPKTRYAVAPDGIHVPYQVVGDGALDLVFLCEWMSSLDVQWPEPSVAGPREILVSRTVVDLVAGSRTTFADRGTHTLKGVPGTWQLFALQ